MERKTSFALSGAIEKPETWTVEKLGKEFSGDIKTVPFTLKGEKGTAKCVSLIALVQAAKLHVNPKIKNHELAFCVVVKATDGYTVAFSFGELSPTHGKRDVWIALEKDGKPLSDRDAPVQLIVSDDEKPARWVHAVTSISVVDTAAAQK